MAAPLPTFSPTDHRNAELSRLNLQLLPESWVHRVVFPDDSSLIHIFGNTYRHIYIYTHKYMYVDM